MPRPAGGYVSGYVAPSPGAGVGVWSARDLAQLRAIDTWPVDGLALWLDAHDSSTLYDATTGGSLVAADGTIGRWVDKSGNGYAAIQSTANNRPTRKTAIQARRDVVRFDGTNDTLQISSIALNTYVTVFVVQSSTSSATTRWWMEHGANTNSNDGFYFQGVDSAVWAFNRSSSIHYGPAADNSDWIGNGWTLATLTYNGTGTIYKNATQTSNATGSGTARSNTSATAALNIGSRAGSSKFLNGDLGEVLIFNRVLSSVELATVHAWLNARWRLY